VEGGGDKNHQKQQKTGNYNIYIVLGEKKREKRGSLQAWLEGERSYFPIMKKKKNAHSQELETLTPSST